MRRTASSGSAKAIWLDREEVIRTIRPIALEAGEVFPEILEIRLIGSLARKEHTGTSDIDLFILTAKEGANPIERNRPYFMFFAERLDIALDLLVATAGEAGYFRDALEGSVVLYSGEGGKGPKY
jgi:predicted nucleotidyltransferase